MIEQIDVSKLQESLEKNKIKSPDEYKERDKEYEYERDLINTPKGAVRLYDFSALLVHHLKKKGAKIIYQVVEINVGEAPPEVKGSYESITKAIEEHPELLEKMAPSQPNYPKEMLERDGENTHGFAIQVHAIGIEKKALDELAEDCFNDKDDERNYQSYHKRKYKK